MPEKFAILLDGGFVKEKLREKLPRGDFPSTDDIVSLCKRISGHSRLHGKELLRVYYYDAPPLDGTAQNPIDGSVISFSDNRIASRNKGLIDSLEMLPDFAVRRGNLLQTGWKLGSKALRSLKKKPRPLTGRDLVPDISQKGVDLRIGLDIATIALKRAVEVLVLVSGDSDLVPAMKLARVEGLRVYLDPMGHGVRRELKAHADFVLGTNLDEIRGAHGERQA